MKDWHPYPNERKILKKTNHWIIVPADYDVKSVEVMPLFCPVCDFRFSSYQDEDSYKKFQCCGVCADTWAYANKEKWKNGWRPSNEQIKKAAQRRSIVNKHIRFK